MKKLKKIILGLITIWPIIYMVLFITFICALVVFPMFVETLESSGGKYFAAPIFILHGLTMLIMLGLMVFYFIHAMKNEKLEGFEKVVWIIVLVMAGIVTMPIYWYVSIWKEGSIKLFQSKTDKKKPN
jgi:hypothetical protein